MSEVATTPCAAAPGQQLDSWLNFPSQWDYVVTPDLTAMEDAAHSLLPNEELNTGSTGTPWTIAGDTMARSFDAEEPSGDLGQLPNGDTQGSATAPGDVILMDEQHPMGTRPQTTQAELDSRVPVDSNDHRPFRDAPRELFNIPTALSEYFFREVITLYCSWDGESNVMRTLVENMWQSSEALHCTIQSMAAACLSEDFPRLLSVAQQEHIKALQLIQSTPPSPTHKQAMLLAAMFLGHTSSWLSPHNLATDLFRSSCSMLKDIAAETDHDPIVSFFNDTMDYWAMLLAHVTDSQQLGDYHRDISVRPTDHTKPDKPHPYSGISRDMIRTLRDTGILIFWYRKHMSTVKFVTEKDLDVFRVALREARRLERILLAHRPPILSQTQNTGDPKTPLKHLELMDEAYQYTGLLQLYRVFPDLLNERYAPWNKDDILRPPPAVKMPTGQERQTWLTNLALHILGILGDIPFESRTRSAQPFIMVAVSSELRRDSRHFQMPEPGTITESNVLPTIDQTSVEVARARRFVGSRLAAYTHILPLRKSRVISGLIKHVWSALDNWEQDVYWLDIAYQKHLGTMMG